MQLEVLAITKGRTKVSTLGAGHEMFNPILRSGRGAQIVSDLRFSRFVVSVKH